MWFLYVTSETLAFNAFATPLPHTGDRDRLLHFSDTMGILEMDRDGVARNLGTTSL